MELKSFKYEVKENIAIALMDEPSSSMNVLSNQMMEEFELLLSELESNDQLLGLIIGSAKDTAFLAGANLHEFYPMLSESVKKEPKIAVKEVGSMGNFFRRLETTNIPVKEIMAGKRFPKPVVTMIDGLALGGGFELIMASHYKIASDNPKVKLGLPEVLIGIFPGAGGSQRLPRYVGFQQALQMMTTGKNIDAMTAKSFGIVNEIVKKDEMLAKAMDFIKKNPKVIQPWDKKGFKYPGGSGAMHPHAVQIMMAANAMTQDKSKHNYPAIKAILSCVYEGSIVPFDKALEIEAKYFYNILKDPISKNMIRTNFINKQALEKGAYRPKNIEKQELKKIGILGAGMMGAAIANVSVNAGLKVVLLDRDEASVNKGKSHIEKYLGKSVMLGKMTQEKAEQTLANVTATTDINDFKDVDLVIEAVFEDPTIKEEITKRTQAVTGKDIIFASNTSTIPISDLAKNSLDSKNFIGVHFFSPVEKMPLVEIIMGNETGDKALATALDYVKMIKKTPIVVKDRRGFYVNSVVIPYLNEAMIMVKEGIKPALIENAALMLGMPVGPLALTDETSLDLGLKIVNSAKHALGDKYVPTGAEEVLETMVNKLGRLGRKSKSGFYNYPENEKKYLWPEISDYFPQIKEQPDVNYVKDRLLYIQLVNACNCIADGTLDHVSADIGALFGFGFAPYSGGPMSYIDMIGLDKFFEKVKSFANHGNRFDLNKNFMDKLDGKKSIYS